VTEAGDPQKSTSEPLGIEQPCATNGRAVRRDLRAIARMVHGVVVGAQTGKRFPGGQINPGGQSFDKVVNTLKSNGFVFNHSLDHPEGESYQKMFNDGFWYHVVINYPKDAQYDPFTEALSNPQSPTPLVTAHCHSTDPEGWLILRRSFLGRDVYSSLQWEGKQMGITTLMLRVASILFLVTIPFARGQEKLIYITLEDTTPQSFSVSGQAMPLNFQIMELPRTKPLSKTDPYSFKGKAVWKVSAPNRMG
jgi:hypothetical protein